MSESAQTKIAGYFCSQKVKIAGILAPNNSVTIKRFYEKGDPQSPIEFKGGSKVGPMYTFLLLYI